MNNSKEDKKCFHHECNIKLKKAGFITGSCVINWEIPCGGTPESVPFPHRCKGFYVPTYKINNLKMVK